MKNTLLIILILFSFFNALPGNAVETGVEQFAPELTEKGWRYFKIGDVDTALKRFRQATILDPDFAPAYFAVGYIYSLQNRLSLAIQYYRKAVDLADPPDSRATANLGLALMMTGQEQEGFEMVQKALELDPENGEAHLSLCNYYCAQKQGKLSREHLKVAKKLGIQPDPKLIEQMKTECP